MNRHELAYVLLRLTALSFLLQGLVLLPYTVDFFSAEGALSAFSARQFLSALIRVAIAVGLWVTSPRLSKLIAND